VLPDYAYTSHANVVARFTDNEQHRPAAIALMRLGQLDRAASGAAANAFTGKSSRPAVMTALRCLHAIPTARPSGARRLLLEQIQQCGAAAAADCFDDAPAAFSTNVSRIVHRSLSWHPAPPAAAAASPLTAASWPVH
jgi:hypothetical protein